MQAALHQLGQDTPQDGASRVVVNVGNHRLAVPLVEAHRVVVIVVEQWTLLPAHQCVIFLPLPLGHGTDEGALAVVEVGLLAQPCRCLRAMAIVRYRAIDGRAVPLLPLPVAGAGGLERLHDVAQAPLHGLHHFYHAVEMVGHTDAGVYCHVIAVRCLFLGDGFPRLLHRFAQR